MRKHEQEKEDRILFAVMRLDTDVVFTNPITGEEVSSKVAGIAGYIPVYDNEGDAIDASCDGKYEIFAIKPK